VPSVVKKSPTPAGSHKSCPDYSSKLRILTLTLDYFIKTDVMICSYNLVFYSSKSQGSHSEDTGRLEYDDLEIKVIVYS